MTNILSCHGITLFKIAEHCRNFHQRKANKLILQMVDLVHMQTRSLLLFSVCNQASLGVAAIFGPRSAGLAGYINSMCNTLEVPHIEARLEPRLDAHDQQVFSINVYPQTSHLSRVYLDLIRAFRWTKLCVIYGDHSGQFAAYAYFSSM